MRRLFASLLFLSAAALPAQAAANPIGIGCLGSNGRPSLGADAAPTLGSSVTLTLASLPLVPGQVWWLWGFNDISWAGRLLPVDMGFAGAPGCLLYLRPEFQTFQIQDRPDTLSTTFAVPVQVSLLSCRLLCQALVCDSGINAVGYTSTNGLELLFGP